MSSKEYANRLAKALESTGLVTVVKADFSDDQVRLMCRVTKQPPNKEWIAVVHRILLATDFSRGYAHAWNAHICQLYFLKEDKGEKRIVFGWNLSIQASMMSEALDRIIKVVKGAQPKPEPKIAGEVEEMDLGGSFTGKRMAEKNGGGHNIGSFSPARPEEVVMTTKGRELSATKVMNSEAYDVQPTIAPPETATILAGDGMVAGYKIEITFGPGRSSFKDYPAFISLWESGKHFHGGGDSLMYWCLDCAVVENPMGGWQRVMAILDKKESADRYGCGHPIPAAAMNSGIAICPNCQKILNTDRLTNPLPFIGTSQELARFVARYFHVLKDNVDIYCKYHPKDIRYKGMEAKSGLATARRLKGMFIYPLSRILKDTVSGAKLEDKFKAFFNA